MDERVPSGAYDFADWLLECRPWEQDKPGVTNWHLGDLLIRWGNERAQEFAAAALADHEAEPWRALVEDFVCWLDSAPDDRATFGADMDKLDAIARRARAALSGDTRDSAEEARE